MCDNAGGWGALEQRVFLAVLRPGLLRPSEEHALVMTRYTNVCLVHTSSRPFRLMLARFLLGSGTEPEAAAGADGEGGGLFATAFDGVGSPRPRWL